MTLAERKLLIVTARVLLCQVRDDVQDEGGRDTWNEADMHELLDAIHAVEHERSFYPPQPE